MQKSNRSKGLTIGKSGEYRIVVQGRLASSFSERLAGMQITHESPDDGPVATILIGRLRDQAELSGVLNSLYDLHFPVLSVDLLSDEFRSMQ